LITRIENEDLEKQANKLQNNFFKKTFFLLVVFITLFFSFNTVAQNTEETRENNNVKDFTSSNASFEKGKEYILGGISVTGLKKFSEETVRVFTGLQTGQKIKLPGDKLTSSIKKLYESKQFSNVDVYLSKVDNNTVFLEFNVLELPQLNTIRITGLKKSKEKEILKETELKKGAMVTDNLVVTTKNYITKKYKDKGYLKTKVNIATRKDSIDNSIVDMSIYVDKGKRIKIKDISFTGNEAISDKKLRGSMKNTKEKRFGRFWKKSKYIEEEYQEDLEKILDKYSRQGYRDARILSEGITWNEDNTINVNLELEEGKQYRFSEILFVGNKEFTDEQLQTILKINNGDVYNGALLEERINGDGTPNSVDVSSTYQDAGFLFSSVNTVETKVENDSITVEIRIREDEKARIKKVTVSGNERTNDHVIFRELRVKPGDLFSRSGIIRSIREIGQLGFFEQEVTPDVNPDYNNKTVDINFNVAERGSSQIELQGGYGGGSFIGTLGLSFNNFSIRNILNKKAYQPLPMGDGQALSLRLQSSRTFNTYSFSFSEPWLGGKKPKSLSFSVYSSNQFQISNFQTFEIDRSQKLGIIGASVGLGQRLNWPDDYFQLSQSISYQSFNLNNYQFNVGGQILDNANLNNLSYNATISRNSAGPSLIFPTYGSEFSFGVKATFPYSLVNGKDFTQPDGLSTQEQQDFLADKFKWLEYYKFNFKGKWYTSFTDKLVLMSNAEFGFLGFYNEEVGYTPFERYYVGGDGQAVFQLDGREIVGLRGYDNLRLSSQTGGTIYNKFQMELRYSISDAPTASIYALSFIEAGNSYDNFSEFNPFRLKRSAGFGARIFMPAFGLLGIDLGHGFDALPGQTEKSGWQTHFVIGRQF
jgi:outer membrane protein insertion porin family